MLSTISRSSDGGNEESTADKAAGQSGQPSMSTATPPATQEAVKVAAPAPQQTNQQKSKKRPICQGCSFPPRTCICLSLPSEPLRSLFKKCRIVVLQHPHELRRKNRSLPLVELCLFGRNCIQGKACTMAPETIQKSSSETNEDPDTQDSFVMRTVVNRRFGDSCDSAVMKVLRDPNEVVVLVFPHKQAMDLEDGICLAEERCGYNDIIELGSNTMKKGSTNNESGSNDTQSKSKNVESTNRKKMTLVFIDATWKHAREMESKTHSAGEWPNDLIRVQMTPTSWDSQGNGNENNADQSNGKEAGSDDANNGHESNHVDKPTEFIERRFNIRAPPSPDHLSTAECLAWVATRVEKEPQIYRGIMKSLDYMVDIWRGFSTGLSGRNQGEGKPGKRGRVREFTNGDRGISGCGAISQKR